MSKRSKYLIFLPMILVGLLGSCGLKRNPNTNPDISNPDIAIPEEPEMLKTTYKDFSNDKLVEVSEKEALDVFNIFQRKIKSYHGAFNENSTRYTEKDSVKISNDEFVISFTLKGFKILTYDKNVDSQSYGNCTYNYINGNDYMGLLEGNNDSYIGYNNYILFNEDISCPRPEISKFYSTLYSGNYYYEFLNSIFNTNIVSHTTKFYKLAGTSTYKIVFAGDIEEVGMYYDENFIYQGDYSYKYSYEEVKHVSCRKFAMVNKFEDAYALGMIARYKEGMKNFKPFTFKMVNNFKDFSKNTFEPVSKSEAEPIIIQALNNLKNTNREYQILSIRKKGIYPNSLYEHIVYNSATKSFFQHIKDNYKEKNEAPFFKGGIRLDDKVEFYDLGYGRTRFYKSLTTQSINHRFLYNPIEEIDTAVDYTEFIYHVIYNSGLTNPHWFKDKSSNIYKVASEDGIVECYFDSNLIYEILRIDNNKISRIYKINFIDNMFDRIMDSYLPLFDNMIPYDEK